MGEDKLMLLAHAPEDAEDAEPGEQARGSTRTKSSLRLFHPILVLLVDTVGKVAFNNL